MPLQTATISGQLLRPDLSAGAMTVTIHAVSDGARLAYNGKVIAGKVAVNIHRDGTATVTLPLIPQTGLTPVDALWRITWKSGGDVAKFDFTLTGDVSWDDLVDVSDVPITPSIQAAAEAARDAALAAQTAAAASAVAAAASAASATAIADPTGGYAHQIGNSNGSDDTTALNALLATSPKLLRGTPGQNYLISAPLIIKSGTTLDMTGCTVTLKAGNQKQMVANAAALTPAATAADGATSVGSNVVTTSLGASAVVGQTLWVAGAAGNGNGPLMGIVTAKTSTTITINKLIGGAANATTAVTGAAVRLYTRDSNITVKGGSWDRGANGPDSGGSPMAGIIGHSFYMAHIDGLRIDLDKVTSTHGITFVWITDASDFEASIHGGSVVRTAMQIVGPIYNGRIPYLRGSSNDDLLNICGNVYPDQTETAGDVQNVGVGIIYADTVGGSAFKVNSGQGFTIDGITCQQIGGVCNYGAYIGEDTAQAATTGGNYGSVNFGHIDVTTSAGRSLICAAPTIRHLVADVVVKTSLRGVSIAGTNANVIDQFDLTIDVTGAVSSAVEIGGSAVINRLVIRGRVDSSATGATVVATSGSPNAKRIEFDRVNAVYSASPAQLLAVGGTTVTVGAAVFLHCRTVHASNANSTNLLCYLSGTPSVTEVQVIGGRYETGAGVLRLESTVTTFTHAFFDDLHMVNCDRIAVLIKSCKVLLGTIVSEGGVNPFLAFTGGASVAYDIWGGRIIALSGTSNLITRGSTELIAVFSPELSVDVSKVTKVRSTFAINDNGSLACGTGPVICNGTLWKHLYTGTTYTAPQ